MSLELSRGGPGNGPSLNPEQQLQLQQQRGFEREERQAQQLPQVQEALDKKISEHPALQNFLQRYQPDVQDDIKQALAVSITQQLGPHGLKRIDQLGPTKDGGIIVRFNEFHLAELRPEQLRHSADGHNLAQSLQPPATPERQQAREHYRERQQQHTLEREQRQAQHLPQVSQALDKKISDTPLLQNHLQRYPAEEQNHIKQALAKSITQELGPNGLQRIDQIRPTNDGGIIVRFNEFNLVKLEPEQLPQPIHRSEPAAPTQQTAPRPAIEQPVTQERQAHQHTPETLVQAPAQQPTRQTPSEREQTTGPRHSQPDIQTQPEISRDPQQRLADIQQQIEPLLGNQLKSYTPEQQKQLITALTQEVGDFARDTPNIQRIQTGEDGRLTVHYDKIQHVSLDPQEVLRPSQPMQPLQRDSVPELDAFGQLRQQTEQQLSQHLDPTQYGSLQQNILTNRLTEAIREHGGEEAHIKQISERQDGRLQIDIAGQPQPLLLSPQALLAEQGLAEPNGLPGIELQQPRTQIDYTVQPGDGLARIGQRISPEHPDAAAWYVLQDLQQQHGTKGAHGIHYSTDNNRINLQPGQHGSIDLTQKTEQELTDAARHFRQYLHAERGEDTRREVVHAQEQARLAEQQRQQVAQHQAEQDQSVREHSVMFQHAPDKTTAHSTDNSLPPPGIADMARQALHIGSLNNGVLGTVLTHPPAQQHTNAHSTQATTTTPPETKGFAEQGREWAAAQLQPLGQYWDKGEHALQNLLHVERNDQSLGALLKREAAKKVGEALGSVEWLKDTGGDLTKVASKIADLTIDSHLDTLNKLSGGQLGQHIPALKDAGERMTERATSTMKFGISATHLAIKANQQYMDKRDDYIMHPGKFVADVTTVAKTSGQWIKDKTVEQAEKSHEAYQTGNLERHKLEGKIQTEIAFNIATLGMGGGAVKGAQVLNKGEKIVEVVNALDKAIETVNVVDKSAEVAQGLQTAEKVLSAADKTADAAKTAQNVEKTVTATEYVAETKQATQAEKLVQAEPHTPPTPTREADPISSRASEKPATHATQTEHTSAANHSPLNTPALKTAEEALEQGETAGSQFALKRSKGRGGPEQPHVERPPETVKPTLEVTPQEWRRIHQVESEQVMDRLGSRLHQTVDPLQRQHLERFIAKERDIVYVKEMPAPESFARTGLDDALRDAGLSRVEFNELRLSPIDSLNADQQRALKLIRERVPKIGEDTLIQKAIPGDNVEKYLAGEYTEVGGYVSRADDVKHLKSFDEVFESLRLDYDKTDFARNKPYGIVRFKAADASAADAMVPAYGSSLGGKVTYGPPCTQNGFLAGRNGEVIAEFYAPYSSPQNGAKLIIVRDGEETLVGIFNADKDVMKFVSPEEFYGIEK